MRSRLWIKAFLFTFAIVAASTLAFILSNITTVQDSVTTLEVRNAQDTLESVYRLVLAKYEGINSFHELAKKAKKEQLKNILRVVESYLRLLQDKVERGQMSKEEAQAIALEQVRKLKYGGDDYVFICNFDYVIICHPDAKMDGVDYSKVLDVHGNPVIPPIVDIARRQGEGFSMYWWNRLGEQLPAQKLTFSVLFEPWDWVIGTGVYIDDIEKEVAFRQKELISELKALMSSITLGETGYMFIFDDNFNMIIHPDPKLEGGNFGDMMDPASGLPLGQEMVTAAGTPGGSLEYMWDHPNDPGNYQYEKISWVKRFEPFDWYLASSVYVDEIGQTSRRLTFHILVSSLLVLLVFSMLAALLIRRFVVPLERLSATAMRVGQGDFEERSGVRGDDEIGVLGREFDHMVERLQSHVQNLDAMIQEKTVELQRQNDSLEDANSQIQDSMDYASRIQSAILPPVKRPPQGVRDLFVIWRPKEVLGGDFYWVKPVAGGFFAAVVDCTGHGVPGAIMTMIAHMALSQAVTRASLDDPAAILEELDSIIRSALGQGDNKNEVPRDGLEIGLVGVSQSTGQIHFAGAGIDLFFEDCGEVGCIRAGRREIGGRSSRRRGRFSNHLVTLGPGAWIYLFSDGFIEQRGGEKGFCLGRSRVMGLLTECCNLPSEDRKELLLSKLFTYMKHRAQLDDITVLGMSINPQ